MAQTTFSNGWVFTTFPPPPVGFDIDQASDSELAEFGIPRFASGSKAHRRISHLARHGGFIEPAFTLRESKRRNIGPFSGQLPPPVPGAGAADTGPWAGAMVFPSAVGTPEADRIGWIEGTWSIPGFLGQTTGDIDIGIGLGGWLETGFLTVGMTVEVVVGDNAPQLIHPGCAWWPGGVTVAPVGVDTLSCAVGDEMYCWILYLPYIFPKWVSPGAPDTLVFMENMTEGWATYFYTTPPDDVLPFQGTTGEWFVHPVWGVNSDGDPAFVGFAPPVTFLDCRATTAGGVDIDSASADTTNATDAGGNTKLEASLPASNRVQVRFV